MKANLNHIMPTHYRGNNLDPCFSCNETVGTKYTIPGLIEDACRACVIVAGYKVREKTGICPMCRTAKPYHSGFEGKECLLLMMALNGKEDGS